MPIQFPVAKITPTEDLTERALHRAIELSKDFDLAIADAMTGTRAIQIRERIGVCIALLTESENEALRKMDSLD